MQFMVLPDLGKPTRTGCRKIGSLITVPIRKRMKSRRIAIILNRIVS
jgi:hypothetical protein